MNNDRKLVYSTEHGSLGKSKQAENPKRKKQKKNVSAPVIKNPNKQGVRIRRESKGRGGKTVTIIDGLPLSDNDLKPLLKKLKAQLGTGGSVKNGCLEIQGDHREKLLVLLEKQGHQAKLAGG